MPHNGCAATDSRVPRALRRGEQSSATAPPTRARNLCIVHNGKLESRHASRSLVRPPLTNATLSRPRIPHPNAAPPPAPTVPATRPSLFSTVVTYHPSKCACAPNISLSPAASERSAVDVSVYVVTRMQTKRCLTHGSPPPLFLTPPQGSWRNSATMWP